MFHERPPDVGRATTGMAPWLSIWNERPLTNLAPKPRPGLRRILLISLYTIENKDFFQLDV